MTWKQLKDHIEVGIIHRTLFPEAKKDEALLLQTVGLITDDPYFDRIEVPTIKDPVIRKKLKQKCQIAKMEATYATSPIIFEKQLNLNSSDKSERKRAVEEIKRCFEDAVDFGSDRLTLISGPKNEARVKEEFEALRESIYELSDVSEKVGLPLHLELHATDIDKKRLMGSTQDAVQFLAKLEKECPSFSYLIDLSHFPLLGETIADSVFPLKNRIGYVHVGNCVTNETDARYGDTHPYFGYPTGDNDVPELAQFFHALHEVGYLNKDKKAPITIETIKWGDEEPEALIVNGKRALQQAWEIFTRKSLG